MSAAIGPGDWVECVGPFVSGGYYAALQAAGYRFVGAYRVGLLSVCEAVNPEMELPDGRRAPGIKVRDVKAFKGDREVWLLADQWRPIYRPSASLIESLKAPLRTPQVVGDKSREAQNA